MNVRKQIYFDYAATSVPKPEEVTKAVVRAMNSFGNAGRGVHAATMSASGTVFETRQKLADFFGVADSSRIAFTSNATESLNIAVSGMFEAGDHVITTCVEHNSVLRPLHVQEEKGGLVTYLSCDEKGLYSYEEMEAAITEKTKAIVTCHASNVTGNLYDLERIGQIAKRHNLLLVVDAAQTAGSFPIDVREMNIAVLCFTGHKGLFGPQGTGGIYVREDVPIRPFQQGGSGVSSFDRFQPGEMPVRLEAGTLNSHGIAGLGAAIDYLNGIGLSQIQKMEERLMWKAFLGVCEVGGVTIYGQWEKGIPRSPILAFNLADIPAAQVGDLLQEEYGIATRAGSHCAPEMHRCLGTKAQGIVRASFSFWNTEEEIDYFVQAVRTLAGELL